MTYICFTYFLTSLALFFFFAIILKKVNKFIVRYGSSSLKIIIKNRLVSYYVEMTYSYLLTHIDIYEALHTYLVVSI